MRFWPFAQTPGRVTVGPGDNEERRSYCGVRFGQLDDRDSGYVIQNIDFDRCEFENCALSVGLNPALRTIVRRLSLRNARARRNHESIGAPVFDEVTIENLRCGSILLIWGAAFRRVILKGDVPSIKFNEPFSLNTSVRDTRPLRKANQEFYRNVDWAIDISQARFPSMTVRSIPGQLIRRDSETQVLLSKARLQAGDWARLPLPAVTRVGVEAVVSGEHELQVLAAGRRSQSFKEQMKGIDTLRRASLTLD